ncbi:MAG TPA: hypothetical protein VHI77_06015 [Solirubrobacterales bacterium]|jgi:hypothetical protein|nr:hypothetical protein [Solirubrobacterales bacterium]
MIATIVEGRALLETVIASLIAGVGVTFVFSIAIWGFGRFADLSRSERPIAAGVAGTVAALALVAVGAAVVIGIVVMTRK